MTETVWVDPGRLRGIGARLRATVEETGRNVDAVAAQLSFGGSAGWATPAAARAAATGWQDQLRGYRQRAGAAAQSLVDAADAYEASDRAAQRRHRGPRAE